jgi:hypothetical protein
LRHHSYALRPAQHLTLSVAVSALAAAGLTIRTIKSALAEFQIQEADIEKGAVQLSYRGAVHWGLPAEEEPPLVQSHEFEAQYGLTNWWLFSFTLGTDQPNGEDFNVSSVEFEAQYQVIKREGDGIALAIQGGYEKAINHGDEQNADEIGFGPIVELAKGPLLLTLNPLFTDQVGDNRQTDSLGFDYGWRTEYDFAKHWGVAVEMFGQIEDLANAGSFNDQNHSIGPTLFWNPGESDADEGEEKEGKKGDDEDKVAVPPAMEFSLNVGLQFGLTDATSDTALKFQGELNF